MKAHTLHEFYDWAKEIIETHLMQESITDEDILFEALTQAGYPSLGAYPAIRAKDVADFARRLLENPDLKEAAEAALEAGTLAEAGTGNPSAAYDAAYEAAEEMLPYTADPDNIRLAVALGQWLYDQRKYCEQR